MRCWGCAEGARSTAAWNGSRLRRKFNGVIHENLRYLRTKTY
jgi:hypothetical protein